MTSMIPVGGWFHDSHPAKIIGWFVLFLVDVVSHVLRFTWWLHDTSTKLRDSSHEISWIWLPHGEKPAQLPIMLDIMLDLSINKWDFQWISVLSPEEFRYPLHGCPLWDGPYATYIPIILVHIGTRWCQKEHELVVRRQLAKLGFS